MILLLTAIIYVILCTFNLMKADEQKIQWLLMGGMIELIVFDSFLFLYILWGIN